MPFSFRTAAFRTARRRVFRHALAVGLAGLAAEAAAQPAVPASAVPAPIVVHGDRNFPPYEYLEGGVAQGINVELFRELSSRLGRPIEVRLDEWSASQAAVLAGQGDVLPPVAKTADRVQNYNFTQRLWSFDYRLFGLTA